MKTVNITQFDGGMTNDPRDRRTNVCTICQHFDISTDPYRLTPHYAAESGNSSQSTFFIDNFAYDGTKVYGYGVASTGTAYSRVYERSNFTDASWSTVGTFTGLGARLDRDIPFFTFYKKTGKLYGVTGGQYVWNQTPGGSGSESAVDLTAYSTVSNGIVHSVNDRLYFGYNNKIAQNNNDSWTAAALTLPSDAIITSVCEYGIYLAIATRSSAGGRSRVFLWDMDADSWNFSIDWGEGNLALVEAVEGILVGASLESSSANVGQTRFVFRYYDGTAGAIIFEQLTGFDQTPAAQYSLYKARARERVLFPAIIPIDTTGYPGVWSISRKNGQFVIALEYTYLNTTSIGSLYGLIQVGDFLFASYSDNSVRYMDKTDDTIVYTQTSSIETTINQKMDEEDRPRPKQLHAAAVTTEPLSSGQQVILKYSVDGSAYTTIFTKTSSSPDADTVGYEQAKATDEFTKGRDFKFKVESTGGAKVTGIHYKYKADPVLI